MAFIQGDDICFSVLFCPAAPDSALAAYYSDLLELFFMLQEAVC